MIARISNIKVHDARHTYASLFVMSGGSIYDLKKVLGHVDVKTTEKYAHLSSDHLAASKTLLSQTLGRRQKF